MNINSVRVITKIVAYYRVSTKRQGRTGIGLEAQQKAVYALAERYGATIVGEYIEVEKGRKVARPKLHEAVHHAQLTNSMLVVAKLDRLARNAQFTRTLRDSQLPFICCDNEHANDLTIDLLAVIAEHEARAIATRTKEALAVVKGRGKLLGSVRPGHWDGKEHLRLAGAKKGQPLGVAGNAAAARKRYTQVLMPEIKRRREAGESLETIVTWLNEQGFTTRPTKNHPQGCKFTISMLWRLIERYLGVEYLGRGDGRRMLPPLKKVAIAMSHQ
jgi:DNA invertase Pin-like site-specific DNA recombinase